MRARIVGLSASLRNARRGAGNHQLVDELIALNSKDELNAYLKKQASIHLENFVEAGRKEHLPFDELYKNLKKQSGDRGLSNSETALAAALWAAHQLGCDIEHLSLAEYFPENGKLQRIDELKDILLGADGLLVSGPVYFGDRGSLAQSLLELIRTDPDLKQGMRGKVYGGIAVGAKRNGGQETTLIYQLLDMMNCGMLGVGNDSETTSQYGGTGWAGDVGTMPKDDYGIDTSMGAGRRVARIAGMLRLSAQEELAGTPRVAFWVLQDKQDYALNYVRAFAEARKAQFRADIFQLVDTHVVRCLACDVCPTHIDVDETYRCIIKAKKDVFPDLHAQLLTADAIVPVVYSSIDYTGVQSVYQKFIERTRYLRRGDYIFSDLVCAPLVLEELGAGENMHIRMMTSMIRHHTIIRKPIIGYLQYGALLNHPQVEDEFTQLVQETRRVTAGRLLAHSNRVEHLRYTPVGYVLSAMKDSEDQKLLRRKQMIEDRLNTAREQARERLRSLQPAPLPERKSA